MRIFGRVFVVGVITLLWTGCAGHIVYASGPYKGRVVDAETRQPLAGATVLAVWYREVPTAPHGPAEDYHDALELLADANGEFVVPKTTHFTLIGKIREPQLVVYHPGYAPFPSMEARPQDKDVEAAYAQRFFGVELSKLKTREQRVRHARLPASVDHRIPENKFPNLIRLVNEERQALGFQPIGKRSEPR